MNKTTKLLLYIAKGSTLVLLYVTGALSLVSVFAWNLLDKLLTAINNKLNKDENEREDD